jgi:PAS domain S-box-containing protein
MNAADSIRPASREEDASMPPSRDSLSLCHLLLNQLPVGVFHKDRDGRFVFVNSYFCHLHRVTAAECLGKKADEIAAVNSARDDAHDPNQLMITRLFSEGAKHHALIMQNGRPIESDAHYANVGGAERYVHAIKGPLIRPDGTVIGSQGVFLDITERKRAETQLAEERDLLRALLNSSTDAIYFKDRNSRFIRCSAAMAPLFNLSSPDELIGKSDFDFQGMDHARRAFEDEQEIIRSGRPLIGKTEKEEWPDGRVTWALTSKMPLFNSAGQITGTLGISKNITPFKEAEARVEQLHKQLLQTSREAGMAEVATSILHNVGNVLNSINVSASLLLESAKKSKVSSLDKAAALLNEHAADLGAFLSSDPKGRQFPSFLNLLSGQLNAERRRAVAELELLRDNIEHVKDIVATQQNYAGVCGVTETVKAGDIVEDALRINAGALARHGVAVIREYTEEPALSIEKHKVLQILVNLISNAKFACGESGRNDKQIRINISARDSRVLISVIDNGIGIPRENLTRIFNHGFTTRKDGHGYGLHSGALTAKELGGALTVQSEGPGLGAAFTLELPLQPPSRALTPPAQQKPALSPIS